LIFFMCANHQIPKSPKKRQEKKKKRRNKRNSLKNPNCSF
jgi:hypothetical protein